MKFEEPIKAMRNRIRELEFYAKRLESDRAHVINEELRKRMIEGARREIVEFEDAIKYLMHDFECVDSP